jgi:hypothetical protein
MILSYQWHLLQNRNFLGWSRASFVTNLSQITDARLQAVLVKFEAGEADKSGSIGSAEFAQLFKEVYRS